MAATASGGRRPGLDEMTFAQFEASLRPQRDPNIVPRPGSNSGLMTYSQSEAQQPPANSNLITYGQYTAEQRELQRQRELAQRRHEIALGAYIDAVNTVMRPGTTRAEIRVAIDIAKAAEKAYQASNEYPPNPNDYNAR
jgi:hypothetical protein